MSSYFIYKIIPGATENAKTLELVKEYEKYQEAKKEVRKLRAEQDTGSNHTYKMIFAENPAEAEERLLEHREQPIVKEWEK